MKDIDGYVTKDELYRLISHIKMNPDIVVDDKTCHAIVNAISDMPQTDVQPVKRGFWKALMMSEETGWDLSLTCGHDAVCEYVCSVCGKPAIIDEFGAVFLPDYCPNCGARMTDEGR